MGWWNQDIYGGDAPLEWRENIYAACGAKEYNEKHALKPISADILSEKIDTIIDLINTSETDSDDKNIGYQVLGAIIMHAGFDIDESEDLRKRIIEASEDDDYAKDDMSRKNAMKNFRGLVKNYDFNNPVDVTTINIFEESNDVEDDISKEFKAIFGLMKARIKKLENGKGEKSGAKEYDEGYEAASQEEIDFLTDFMELMSKMEMMGVLFEKIAHGLVGNSVSSGSEEKNTISNEPRASKSSPGTGKDTMPG